MSDAPQINLERIYIKDVSFESPQAPMVFGDQWQPKVKLDMNTSSTQLEEGRFEVALRVTLTTSTPEEVTTMIVEVTQAGVFHLSGLDEAQCKQVLATMCPNVLFPYIREQVDSLMVKGGFPPIHLAPVNFEALYAQAQQAENEAGQAPSH
ncbi:MAG: protein-export chaperone SecB [Pseudomonadota bacterium]